MRFEPTKKSMTFYKLRGRVCCIMAVIITVAFLLFVTMFYGTERKPIVNYTQLSHVDTGLSIRGSPSPKIQLIEDSLTYKPEKQIYAIIFDAGSTGSRVHVYQFELDADSEIQLLKETFEEVKPGLSSYAADPLKAAISLDSMLKKCIDIIPAALHKTTPLVLKATAGLRLLPEGQADNIMNEVTYHLKKYPFQVPATGVGIMDGVDEGVFSWMTVNFMLGLLGGNNSTVPALDLGGGSTQITFVPEKQETLHDVPNNFLKKVNLFQKDYQLYTHSYLNLGLMSARFTLIGGENHEGAEPSSFQLSSPCIANGYSGNYTHAGNVYNLRGSESASLAECMATCSKLVKQHVKPTVELSGKELYIFSYFYDRARDSGLIGEFGGTIQIEMYKKAAETALNKASTDSPFLALDLAYIYSLLTQGYGLSDNTRVHLSKKIAGVEVSWGLGAAFQVLTDEGLLV